MSERVFERANHRHGLRAEVSVTLGKLDLVVDITVEPGELVAVLGPNGAGKSTLLRCIAGLLPIDHGTIIVDGSTLDDADDDTFVPPARRPIGVVFQDYLLFEHMSALENIAFGLRATGTPRREARAAATEWLDRVGLTDHAGHPPSALSGGQQQRVALARALARNPRVVLLDEPLAALDAGARGEVRRDLRRHLESFEGMRLMVTHDPVDAYALADRIVVLEHGTIVQSGSLNEVTARPRSRYIADLVGLNLVTGDFRAHALTTDGGGTVVTVDSVGDGEAFVAIRPQAVSLHRTHPEGSARNVWQLTVDDIDQQHDRARVRLAGAIPIVAEVTPAAVSDLGLRLGDEVWVSVKATDIEVYAR